MSRLPKRAHGTVVLGVDPGTLVTGYAIVERSGAQLRLLTCGVIKNASGNPLPIRLKKIHAELCAVIDMFHPDEFAIESAFYGKNAQSALKLGHARGVSILAAVERNIPSSEYSPREVKKAVTGNGHASKPQVQYMVRTILDLPSAALRMDMSDAIAIAICHIHRFHTSTAKHKDWKSFLTAHPERVRS